MGQALNLGLRARIALVVGAVMALTIGAVVAATAIDFTDDLERALQSRSTAIAKSLRLQLDRVLQLGIGLEDLAGFETQLQDAVANYPGISAAFVVDREGKILFHSDFARIGASVASAQMLQAVAQPREAAVRSVFRGQEMVTAVVPVLDRFGAHLGSVLVAFPAEVINAEVRELVTAAVGAGAAVFVAGMALLLAVLSGFVTRPLSRLAETVNRLRRGEVDFSTRASGKGAGEIGVLIEGFNGLLEHIQQRDAQLVSLADLKRSEASLAYAQELARVGNWEWRPGQPDYWSGEMYRILGLDPATTSPGLGTFLKSVVPDARAQVKEGFEALVAQGGKRSTEIRIVRPDGEVRDVYQKSEVQYDAQGRAALVRGTMQDVTEQKQIERRMRTLAHYDGLTGLPNRGLFKEQLARELRRAERAAARVAVMFLDLDRFKQINDSLGHPVGDALLKSVAERLNGCLRGSDNLGRSEDDASATARLGGDEFTVMLTGLALAEDAAKVAQRIVEAMARPFAVEGHELYVSASVGVAVYPEDGADVDTLLKNADVAMYNAKDDGRNNYKFYSSQLNARALDRLTLERDLHRAQERGELLLHYQPQVESATGQVTGVEALLRWNHPERGLVPPAQFIPIAEQNGLIVPIGEWVLHEACRQAHAWSLEAAAPPQVWVNVSGIQFRDRRLTGAVRRALEASGLAPGLLVIEATETIMLEERDATLETLRELKAIGIGIAIDDFGTGYSSLAYLKRFPLDTLKIDGSFVRDLAEDADDRAIISAIIAMAGSLKLEVLAEGVETEEQAALLRALGCSRMQGYLFSRPVPAAQIAALLASGLGGPARSAPGAQRKTPRLHSVS
jgi:diguanylate cyclase (GGDEF)-like protein/PAS domain S-box-containing protein